MTVKRTQKAGGSCGATNNKMKGGAAHSAANNKMKGGAKSKKSTKKSSHKLAKGEAVCFNCRKAGKKFHVKIVNPVTKSIKTSKRTMKLMSGKCPVCGGKVNTIVGA
jgi:hypothetical protein